MKYCPFCGKEQFLTYWAAYRVLHRMMTAEHHNKGSCYRCHVCHFWHVTHYSNAERDMINEKRLEFIDREKRSMAQAKNVPRQTPENQGEQERINYYIYLKEIKMQRHQEFFRHVIFSSNDRETIDKAFDELMKASADIKNNMGICIGCTRLVYADMLDKLRTLPQYRMNVKRAFAKVDEAWRQWEVNAIHTPDSRKMLPLFSLSDFDEKSRSMFRDGVTDAEYFDMVIGTGGSAYMKSWPQMMCLRHKFRRAYESQREPHADTLSWLSLVSMLIELCVEVYSERMNDYSKELFKHIRQPSASDMFRTLDLSPVKKAFFEAFDMLPQIKKLSDSDVQNMALTASDIRHDWLAFENVVEHINNTCDNFDDVIASKELVKRVKCKNAEQLAEFRRERMDAIERETLKKLERKIGKNQG